MSKKKAINFDLSEIADGGVQVKLNRALQQVADNILDPNTDPTKKRKVQLNITLALMRSGMPQTSPLKLKLPLLQKWEYQLRCF